MSLRIMRFDCSPSDITQAIGMQPTRIWHEGEPTVPGTGIINKQNGWGISSGLGDDRDFASHVDALYKRITDHIEEFTEIGNRYHAEIACALYLYDYRDGSIPTIRFTRHETDLLQRIGAEIDFDIYILGAAERISSKQPAAPSTLFTSQQAPKEFHDISLELRITRFPCTPQEITGALGVQQTRFWHQGDPQHGDTGQLYQDNGWAITSGLPQNEEFQTHLEALLAIIEPRLDAFTDICTRYHAELWGTIQMYDELEVSTPWIHIDKPMMRILAQLGAEVILPMTVSPADS